MDVHATAVLCARAVCKWGCTASQHGMPVKPAKTHSALYGDRDALTQLNSRNSHNSTLTQLACTQLIVGF